MPDEDEMNQNVTFIPQVDEDERPCLVVGGVQVYAYFQDGELRVSVDYDEALMQVQTHEGIVPTRITLSGTDVYVTG